MFPSLSALFGGDEPKLKLQTIVKNQPIQSQIDYGVDRNTETQRLAEDSIKSFMDTFRATQPQYQAFTEEGIGRVGDIYSGKLATQYQGLRDRQRAARLGATEQALARARGGQQAQAAASGVQGGNSYRDLMEARIMNEIMAQAALEDAALERGDFNTMNQLQMGNLTTRQQLLQGLEGREALPLATTATMRGIPMQNLAQLQQLDEANKMYNLYRQRGVLERLSDFENTALGSLGNYLNLAQSAGSVMSGSGQPAQITPSAPTGAAASAMPSTGSMGVMSSGYYNPTPIPAYNPSLSRMPSIPASSGYHPGALY